MNPEPLRPPANLVATGGRAQVTLSWEPVDGACGYQVYRADRADGSFEPVDHLGLDVLAVPHPPYCDTTGEPGHQYWYSVAALSAVDMPGSLCAPVACTPLTDATAQVDIVVAADSDAGPLPRPWRPMIGSEHLSHLLSTETTGGRPIGSELASALAAARGHFNVRSVRAHGILGDDLRVYREVDGSPVYDFTGVDRVYDRLLGLGLRPVVELSFMPRDLAADPAATVFHYQAVVSPPKDWDRWAGLIRALVRHLVGRYGRAEVLGWAFEVWNEANLEVFWSGTPAEFWRLYEVTAKAVKDVDPALKVGGPASAAAGQIDEMLSTIDSSTPVDFVSTHTYGSPPLDIRPQLARHGRPGLPIWWTEWGVSPRHFHPVNDSVLAAAFLARGMRSAAGRVEALSYWVASDHFEELGRPPSLLHGGFGLRAVGDLAKPRFWALAMLERLGERELRVTAHGDGAGSLVETWAGRDPDGSVAVAVWNGTLDQSKADGHAPLNRTVRLRFTGLSGGYVLRHHRVDEHHSNIAAVWRGMSGDPWPTEEQWAQLREANELERIGEDRDVEADVELTFTLPMPSISLIELVPR
ncbi:xylan 1,4-beta-xylosidase [Kibdelosporangium persicum]|uniref:Glycoside hydrolase n=1 Tax=Kibdelosporangium persicum TaxID=2698649 RepID=A0ABX2EVS8_9PSEU|nr:xylan 1,4-beta-xylosidase [Kibdelosporangium persicum]NRN63131.1 Glycoside hydrolase [Kibdelosporangium persicum]